MTTDSGLAYLSGLLRAGAEPLSHAARETRRHAASPPHAARISDHSEEFRDGDEVTAAVKSSDVAGDRHTPSTNVSPGESAVESLPDDVAEGVEQQVQARTQSRVAPPSSMGVSVAFGMSGESDTPAAAPTAPVAVAARTHPADDRQSPGLRADEIRGGETEHTAALTEQSPTVAGAGELVPATRIPLDVEPPTATLHGEPNDSAVTHSEIASAVEGSTIRTSKSKTTDEVVKRADEAPDAHGASFVYPGVSSVRGSSARRDTSARAAQEEGATTFVGDRARVSEDGATSADASADSAPFTLEAHVEHLRALMRTARTETPVEEDGTNVVWPPLVVSSHRAPPLTTDARPAREQPRTAPRAEFEARPETPTPAANSVELQPTVSVEFQPAVSGELQPAAPLSQALPGASSGRVTSATEARPATPRAALTRPGGVAPARVRGEEMTRPRPAPVRTSGATSVAQGSAPTDATTFARLGPAPSREGGSTGPAAAAAGGVRAPKLTINRLDVQVVDRREPPPVPPQPPAPPATASPPGADPWGALDRQLLGRFSY